MSSRARSRSRRRSARRFKGETRKATRRADLVEQLRGPGDGRDVITRLPSGGEERIYISPDSKIRTVRTEMHTKKVKDVLGVARSARCFAESCAS